MNVSKCIIYSFLRIISFLFVKFFLCLTLILLIYFYKNIFVSIYFFTLYGFVVIIFMICNIICCCSDIDLYQNWWE